MQAKAMKEMQGLFNLNGNPFDVQKAFEKMQNGQKALQKMQKDLAEFQTSLGERLLSVLTEEQRSRWTELQGKPLKGQKSQRRKTPGNSRP